MMRDSLTIHNLLISSTNVNGRKNIAGAQVELALELNQEKEDGRAR